MTALFALVMLGGGLGSWIASRRWPGDDRPGRALAEQAHGEGPAVASLGAEQGIAGQSVNDDLAQGAGDHAAPPASLSATSRSL